jgi:hypothetical protein
MESEVFDKSLGFDGRSFVEIDYLPFLCSAAIVVPDLDLVSFFILSSLDIKCKVIAEVDELIILVLEYLPPS